MSSGSLIVIAKSPAPGKSKTRLSPPCSPLQASALAEAALRDTLEAVASTFVARRVVALDGPVGTWWPTRGDFELISQRGNGLDERLASAFEDVGGPALLIGMDTPQVHRVLLQASMDRLFQDGIDAVLGGTEDGGFWAIGLRSPHPQHFVGVPMSSPRTCAEQADRLRQWGLSVARLPVLRDVDRYEDAVAVAVEAPGSRFAASLERMAPELVRTA